MVGNGRRSGQGYLWLSYDCQATRRGYHCEMGSKSFGAGRVDELAWQWVRELCTDPEGVENSLRKYQREQTELTKPLRDRLEVIEGLIAEHEKQLERLLDLYLDGTFAKDVLASKKAMIESTLAGLEEEQSRSSMLIARQVYDESHVISIVGFARRIGQGIQAAEQDFAKRCQLVAALDITGELTIENGDKVVYLHCVLGDAKRIVSNSSNGARSLDRGSYCT